MEREEEDGKCTRKILKMGVRSEQDGTGVYDKRRTKKGIIISKGRDEVAEL